MRHSIPYAITHAYYLLDGPCYLSYSAQGSKARFDDKIFLQKLEPFCFKRQLKKSSWQVTGLWNRGPVKDLNDFKLIVYESK